MRSPPRKIGTAVGRQPHSGEPKTVTGIIQSSANCHATDPKLLSYWAIPAFDDDGLEIYIGGKGHVVIKQKPPFERDAVIVLHPRTARAVLEILPAAIAAANRHRKEME